MKQIILIRHAKVNIDNSQTIVSAALKNWVERYDVAEIHPESKPMQKVRNLVLSADAVVTSSLRRAIDSVKLFDIDIYEQNAIFNEAKIPEVSIPVLKFKPKTWLVILRFLLLLGLGKKDTSLKASKKQAKEASLRLLELSEKHDSVVLVGHGGMNWLIRKVLMKEGWILEENPSNTNWGMTILSSYSS